MPDPMDTVAEAMQRIEEAAIPKKPALERLEMSADRMEKEAHELLERAGRVRAVIAMARDNPPMRPTVEAFVEDLFRQ